MRSAVLVALVVLATARVAAPSEPPVEDPVLAALIAEALERNPDLLAAQADASAARQRIAQARALPDPMLSVGYTNDGWSPSLGRQQMTTLGFMASQDLPFPGKRRLRGEIASREADQIEQQLARARLRVAAEVRNAYYGLLLARELQALTGEQRETWREIEGVVRARYAVGQGTQPDVLRVQVEQTRVEQGAYEQAATMEIRLAELNRLLARPPDAPLPISATLVLRPLDRPLADLDQRLLAISPELASGRLAVERGRLAIALAEKEYRPDFALQMGYMNRGGLDPMWQAGIGITLPINRARRASAVARAAALTHGSEQMVESIELQLRYQTQERYTRLKSTEKIAALYDQGIIPQDRLSVEAAIASYETGKVPFVTVLEAQVTLYGDRWTRARLVADHARLRAELDEASLEPDAVVGDAEGLPLGPGGSGAMGNGIGGR